MEAACFFVTFPLFMHAPLAPPVTQYFRQLTEIYAIGGSLSIAFNSFTLFDFLGFSTVFTQFGAEKQLLASAIKNKTSNEAQNTNQRTTRINDSLNIASIVNNHWASFSLSLSPSLSFVLNLLKKLNDRWVVSTRSENAFWKTWCWFAYVHSFNSCCCCSCLVVLGICFWVVKREKRDVKLSENCRQNFFAAQFSQDGDVVLLIWGLLQDSSIISVIYRQHISYWKLSYNAQMKSKESDIQTIMEDSISSGKKNWEKTKQKRTCKKNTATLCHKSRLH